MHKMLKAAAAGTLVFTLAACADTNRQGADTNNGVRTQNVRPYGVNTGHEGILGNANNRGNRWDNARNNNYTSLHNNTRMEMSQEIADRVAKLPEVDTANVLLTDDNAYVAVVLSDATRNGTNRTGGNPGAMTGDRVRTRVADNVKNAYDRNTGFTDLGMRTPAAGGAGNALDGTGGAGGTDGSAVSAAVKEKIARTVRSAHPGVGNVFVSANPDFVDRLNSYAERARNGQPLRGMIIEFNTMMQRMFPHAVGDTHDTAPGAGTNMTGR